MVPCEQSLMVTNFQNTNAQLPGTSLFEGLKCVGKRGISTYIAVEVLDVPLESTLRPGGVVAVRTTVLEVTVHVRVEMETGIACKYKEKNCGF